jgi:hypothetical protein
MIVSCEMLEFEVREDGLKHCKYCGSLDPLELADLLCKGIATMHGSDWKYGFPHKFYVDVPNPKAGQMVEKGWRSYTEDGVHKEETIMGIASETSSAKFYTEHLMLIDSETFDKVAPIINQACGITFYLNEDGKICYKAPYFD